MNSTLTIIYSALLQYGQFMSIELSKFQQKQINKKPPKSLQANIYHIINCLFIFIFFVLFNFYIHFKINKQNLNLTLNSYTNLFSRQKIKRLNIYFIKKTKQQIFLLILMQKQQQISTPKSVQENNIIKVESCSAKDKTQYTIEYSMSDLAYQEFHGFNEEILDVPVEEIKLLSKELDQPLSWVKKIGASILGLKTKHQFLLFQTRKFLMTIDFYQGNRIRVRVGQIKNVMQTQKSVARKHASIVKTQQGLQWRRQFKQGQFFIRDILDCLKHKQLQKAHSKISFNGSHFSRKLWNDLIQIVQKRK